MKNKLKKIGIIGSFLILSSVFFAFKTNYFEVAKQMEIYTSLFKELNMYYIDEINPADLNDIAIKNMLEGLDPYTRYYDEQGVEDAKINSLGEFSGIGAQIKFSKTELIIDAVYEGFAADKMGIKPGDKIIEIDGVIVDPEKNKEMEALLRGSLNSIMQLKVNRQGKELNFEVKREKVEINPVPHYQMLDKNIGYIAFTKFNGKASSAVKSAFLDLKSQGMTKVILDLRDNPGGLLGEAIRISNFFVPKGEVIVTTKAKVKKWNEIYKTKSSPIDLEIPIVVLVNGRSASASEIVSGSLQDLDRAVIVGQQSFGKGLVQRYRDLSYGSKLKLTISKYYTPSGRNIQELDYTNREGKDVPKFSKENRQAFKTKNGRTVYDGGGIAPDVEVTLLPKTEVTDALYQSDAIFDFATDYYYKNKAIQKPESFVLRDSDYQNFITFIKNNDVNFKTVSETEFEEAYKTSEKENLSEAIQTNYSNLLEQLHAQKIETLNSNKEEIKEHISDEIISRYYYEKGKYINHIAFNESIKKAIEILNNETLYNHILAND